MKRSFLAPRPRSLLSLALLALVVQASAATLTGTVAGGATADTRISAWVVTPFGQPVQELVSASVKDGRFSLALPDTVPPARAQAPINDQISWPGLIDFGKASTNAQAAEMKFFVYQDTNGNGSRDDNEPLREVRLNAGKGDVFIVWASADVTVTASKGYLANLKKGWNLLSVDVRKDVSVKPLDVNAPLKVNIGK